MRREELPADPAAGQQEGRPRQRRVSVLVARLQQQSRQGRTERQRVERRDQRRDGDGQGKLTEELAGDAADEAHGTNTALSTKPTAMTGPDTCSIALIVACARQQSEFHVVLHRFDHDNRVIDDDADGQHQTEQRQVVQTEANGQHDGEGADDGDGHSHQRNDGRAPVLQEQQHHHGHQDDGIAERLDHLVDGLGGVRRGVEGDLGRRCLRGSPCSTRPSWP